MSEKLNTNPEDVSKNSSNNKWDSLAEVPFKNSEQIDKKQAERKEYLDILATVGNGLRADSKAGENSVGLVIEAVDGDKSAYEGHLDEMQMAAKIIDAEMISRKSESAYYDLATKLGSLPEGESEERNALTFARDSALKRMQEAHNLAQEELRKAYPDLDDRAASKKFFGYESWGIDKSVLSSSTNGETFDANGKEVSSENKPDDPERVAMINKAIEIRSNTHGKAYSDHIQSEIGVFRRGEV